MKMLLSCGSSGIASCSRALSTTPSLAVRRPKYLRYGFRLYEKDGEINIPGTNPMAKQRRRPPKTRLDTELYPNFPGIQQWWNAPIRVGPEHVDDPRNVGPDFVYEDGRVGEFTTKRQKLERAHQVELARSAIAYLAQMREIEACAKDAEAAVRDEEAEYLAKRPKPKAVA